MFGAREGRGRRVLRAEQWVRSVASGLKANVFVFVGHYERAENERSTMPRVCCESRDGS